MGRGVRQDIDGGWHHVMNRGADRQRIFFTRRDGEAFEALLAAGSGLSGVEVHCYCLMPNHYHLLVHCPHGGLSEFMQRVASLYARRINDRVDGDGALFRARFKSILLDSPEYVAQVGRYIHRNPKDLSPPVGLVDYRWSSLRYYAAAVESPAWLHTSTLPSMCSGDYVEYVRRDLECSTVRLDALEDAIDMVVEDGRNRRGLARLVSIVLLERCDGDVRANLLRQLDFPTDAARRTATRRSHQKLRASPELERTVQRVLDLLAA